MFLNFSGPLMFNSDFLFMMIVGSSSSMKATCCQATCLCGVHVCVCEKERCLFVHVYRHVAVIKVCQHWRRGAEETKQRPQKKLEADGGLSQSWNSILSSR